MEKIIIKVLIFLVGATLFLGGLFLMFKNSNFSSNYNFLPSKGVLASLASDHYDFGTISMANGVVSHNFILENTGSEPVIISKAYTSCMCTTAYLDSNNLKLGPFGMLGMANAEIGEGGFIVRPKEQLTVRAVFNPAAHGPAGVGLAERTIYLETNSTQAPKIELNFKAVVTP